MLEVDRYVNKNVFLTYDDIAKKKHQKSIEPDSPTQERHSNSYFQVSSLDSLERSYEVTSINRHFDISSIERLIEAAPERSCDVTSSYSPIEFTSPVNSFDDSSPERPCEDTFLPLSPIHISSHVSSINVSSPNNRETSFISSFLPHTLPVTPFGASS